MSNTVNKFERTHMGHICANPRGEYDASVTYRYLDYVSYQGGAYLLKRAELTGVAPTANKTDDNWFCSSISGQATPEYIMMHDQVVDLSAKVSADLTAAEQARDAAEAAQEDVSRMHQDITSMAADTEAAKDSAAGYARAADASRTAAEAASQSAQDLAAAFPATVQAGRETIETARQQAVAVVKAQEQESKQHVIDSTTDYINQETAAAQEAIANTRDGVVQDVQRAGDNAKTAAVTAVNAAGTAQQNQITTLAAAERQEISLTAAEHLVEIEAAGAQLEIDYGELLNRDAQHADISVERNMHHTATAEGDGLVTIRDAGDYYCRIGIDGKHEQGGTTGEQLLDASALRSSGATVAVTQNGYKITCTGKNSWAQTLAVTIDVTPGETIYASAESITWTVGNGAVVIQSNNGATASLTLLSSALSGSIVVPEGATQLRIVFVANANTEALQTDNTAVFTGVVISRKQNAAWEPYTGNQPAPNPDYPQPIHGVGESGSVDITACRNNLFQFKNADNVFLSASSNDSGRTIIIKNKTNIGQYACYSYPMYLPAGTYYVMADSIVGSDIMTGFKVELYSDTGYKFCGIHEGQLKCKLTLTQSCKVEIRIYNGSTVIGSTYTITGLRIADDAAKEFEPYHGQTITVPVDNMICTGDKIRYQDGLWGAYKIWEKYKVTDADSFMDSALSNETYKNYRILNVYVKRDVEKQPNLQSDCFRSGKRQGFNNENTIFQAGGKDNEIYFCVKQNVASTAEEFKEFALQIGLEFIYKLEVPVFQPFQPETQRALNSLVTYTGCTHIIVSDPLNPHITVEYALDKDTIPQPTQTYIESTARRRVEQIAATSTVSGTGLLHAEDSAEWELLDLGIYGQSSQRSTTGEQLLDPSKYSNDTTQNGLIISTNVDGSITVTGTLAIGTELYAFTYDFGEYIDILEDGENYITNESCYIIKDGKKVYTSKFTVDKSTMTSIRPYIQKKVSDYKDGDTYYPMLNVGTAVLPWEPYTGNQPAPNPEYPQEIVSKTISKITVCWKNLFLDNAPYELNFVKGDDLNKTKLSSRIMDGNLYSNGVTVFFESNTAYKKMAAIIYNSRDNKWGGIGYVDVVKGYNKLYLPPYVGVCETMRLQMRSASTVEETKTVVLSNIMVLQGQVPDAVYVPYTAQTVTLSNPVTLHGLPVTSTGNVTIDGQQYAADKLGYEDGLWGILRRVGYYVSNSPKIVQVNPSGEPHLFKITDPTVANNFKIGSKLVCNKYIEGRTSYDNFVIESYRGEKNCPYIGDDRFDNASDLTASFADSPLIIAYELAKPVFEPLPDADQAALNALASYYGVTNILNNANAYMTAKYVRSLDHVLLDITEQFVDLQAQIDQLALSTNNI